MYVENRVYLMRTLVNLYVTVSSVESWKSAAANEARREGKCITLVTFETIDWEAYF